MGLFSFFKSGPKTPLVATPKGVRVRMAPSPTGNLHIGTARATLFNFLFARATGGTFIMRIEDTDRERSTHEFEKNIIEGLHWLGIEWDEFYRQSERTLIYTKALLRLIAEDKAYVSKEPAKDDPTRTVELVRLRNPGKPIEFEDMLRGSITTDPSDLGDFVIGRAIDDPLYHLAVVVDDFEMGITHIIRSDDHISNTPRQILIAEALGYPRPKYIHQPLVLAPDRSKLSKRHGATGIEEYKALGFIPEAIVNYLAFLGWNPGTEKEIFTMSELVGAFTLEKLQKSGAIFDMTKFLWYNREHIRLLTPEDFAARLTAFAAEAPDPRLLPLLQERCSTLREAVDLLAGDEFAFLKNEYHVNPKMLIPRTKDNSVTEAETKERLLKIHTLLHEATPGNFTIESVKNAVWDYAEEVGRGKVLWPMRVALTGAERSPDPFTVASLLGRDETLSRLEKAANTL